MTVLNFLRNYPIFKVGDYICSENEIYIISELPLFRSKDKFHDIISKELPDEADENLISIIGYKVLSEWQNKTHEETLDFFQIRDFKLFNENIHTQLLIKKQRLELIIKLNSLK